MSFKEDFLWGTATASYQIEGAASEGGRGLTVWDMLCRQNGRIHQNQNGSITCNHYRRFREDIRLMSDLGIRAYRFSICWTRIFPAGTGKINPLGVRFYDELIDELLTCNITPLVSLFHWDYPYELYCQGGWLSSDSPHWFSDYVEMVVRQYSDRVRYWATLNEPQCFIGLGHSEGLHAPGDRLSLFEVLRASHNTLLAHGRAVAVIREHAKIPPIIGFAPVGDVRVPATQDPADIAAARSDMFMVKSDGLESKVWSNTWWMDPVFRGTYPEDGLKVFGKAVPKFTDADLKVISEPLDYFGANIYHARRVRAGADGTPETVSFEDGSPETFYGWPVIPEALYWGPKFFYDRYGKSVIITENGMSANDWVALDGAVHDPQRIDFLHRYLYQLKQCVSEGVPVNGYFLWTFTDNFEWAKGFSQRFGIVYVDYTTQKRTPKDSAYWYKNVIESNGNIL